MAVGKSRRIVIDVDDLALKRNLYSALAEDGQSLKEWFINAAGEYLGTRLTGRQQELTLGIAERTSAYTKTMEGTSNE